MAAAHVDDGHDLAPPVDEVLQVDVDLLPNLKPPRKGLEYAFKAASWLSVFNGFPVHVWVKSSRKRGEISAGEGLERLTHQVHVPLRHGSRSIAAGTARGTGVARACSAGEVQDQRHYRQREKNRMHDGAARDRDDQQDDGDDQKHVGFGLPARESAETQLTLAALECDFQGA